MNLIFYDSNEAWENFLPLTYTRPISELRIGILKICEKWNYYLIGNTFYYTKEYLRKKFPLVIKSENLIINSCVLPNKYLIKLINNSNLNEIYFYKETFIFSKLDENETKNFLNNIISDNVIRKEIEQKPVIIEYLWDIFRLNEEEILNDFDLIIKNKESEKLPSYVIYKGDKKSLFIEKGANINFCVINAEYGPIYIGEETEIMDGALIRGPLALCEGSVLKMGAKIYGPTTIGPFSKIGGEINNSVILGYSNKAHEGFLGNSVIGEWCNIGANTDTSNLKNTYETVKMWNYRKKGFINTGLQFAGLIMGDHTKCGINTMFNTGTVIGVCCNLYGEGYHRNFVPSFSWGNSKGYKKYEITKAIETIKKMMSRRNHSLSQNDVEILNWIYENDL